MKKVRNILLLPAIAILALTDVVHADAQPSFKSPEEAVEVLVKATKSHDKAQVAKILGVERSSPIMSSGDDVADENARDEFLRAYDENHDIEKEENKAVLTVGKVDWPFPIPVVEKDQAWRFDAEAGKEEILFRRIGRNEKNAIEVCEAYVDAQNEYAKIMRIHDGVASYAQKVLSSPGKKDGLYWPDDKTGVESPLGELFAEASAEGYGKKGGRAPYHGYYYKILTSQGKSAPGGALDYIAHGRMIGGYALIAWPAEYGNSGVMSFIINHDGKIYQRDLGDETTSLAEKTKSFDPDAAWQQVDEKENL